ncbi:MAG: hypothetical protein ACD_7C00307G0003 [uncultured bacterium]|nr:MAG: hypothetical protein ACD_7C00307G0003 [uncultured bacterium]KKP68421.1 MAG: hypothetical protein UR65_C0059G0003 [Candidatus Moranbacteria bacterium GW2011_GWE2_35_164]KKP68754.1 MAG: hypothetical protein UR66_C0003G0019 [Candidatus Moranbacteria bacterium GW2011_GWE1_35_17]KKP82945.1 MAG: hypothetical protein UR82_C0027G0019 [Candidatus Moranbacteria bacterium GW2011_GWF1_35_5]KKP83061.1 MAG: hypothetical protein UR83_C0040G0009 [Candidatus Moranbacteria bacterium GW2011_GWF2_35_54]
MDNFFQLWAPYLVSIFLFLILVILNVVLFSKIKKINQLTQAFFSGKKGKDLEEVMVNQAGEIKKLEKDIKELFDGYEKIYNIAAKGIQKVGVVRYNPFRDMGGNQSFSIAMLDRNNAGLIISTLATRDGVRVFSKSIIDGECKEFPLLEEEKKAIKIAKTSKKSLTV